LKTNKKTAVKFAFLAGWAVATVLVGGALTSFHQPFLAPEAKIVEIASHSNSTRWRAVHFLSAGCGCSQKVMAHLLSRGLFRDLSEDVVMVDGMSPDPPDSEATIQRLRNAGFHVSHVSSKEIPVAYGLRGVPLLLFVAPNGGVVYIGGYGPDKYHLQDEYLYQQISAGETPKPYPIIGCAISAKLKQRLDPFALKY